MDLGLGSSPSFFLGGVGWVGLGLGLGFPSPQTLLLQVFFFFFGGSILWCKQSGDDPHEDLAKFGLKLKSRSK